MAEGLKALIVQPALAPSLTKGVMSHSNVDRHGSAYYGYAGS
jgi:hypothetical protein